MSSVSKSPTLVLLLILAGSSLIISDSVLAESLKPVVTDFSLQYVDNSYDVPPSSASTKDLYTGETITTTIPGYHVENKSIVATIKNPPGVDAYNFRWKEHNDSRWYYQPFNTEVDQTPPLSAADAYGVPGYASDSEYTVIYLTFIPKSVTSVDVQVQALYGDYHAIPYGGLPRPGGPTYDFYFDGQASYWSDTQTLTISDGSAAQTTTAPPTSTPTTSSFTTQTPMATSIGNLFGFDLMQTVVVVLAVVVAILVAVIILVLRNYRKPK
jgi:hypothetical protein